MKIVITDCSWGSYDVEKQHLPKDAEVVCTQILTEEEVIETCKGAVATLSEYAPFTRRVLEQLPDLKIIANSAMGVDNIDLDAAKELGIAVTNVPDYCFDEVANHAVALYLACSRRIVQYSDMTRVHRWDVTAVGPIYRTRGQNFCLYGFGNIAQRVADRVKPYGFHLYAYDTYASDAVFERFGVTRVSSLVELAELADAFSVHVPLTKETEGTINLDILRRMRRDAVFINIARGPIVCEEDLITARREKMIMAAGLDVVSEEPLPANSELLRMENVIVTPHAAFYTVEAEDELRKRCTQEVVYALTEGRPHVFVNQADFERF